MKSLTYQEKPLQLNADSVGVLGSILCLIHCLVLPLLLPLTPFVVAEEHTSIHISLALFLLAIALYAFTRGYRRHKEKSVILLGTLGVAFLFCALFVDPHHQMGYVSLEGLVTSVGGLLLIGAHGLNIRHCRCYSAKAKTCGC